MVDRRLKLLLPSQPQSLNAIRQEVRELALGTAYEERVSDILVTVSEACTNVVRHAYPGGDSMPNITLECTVREDALKVIVIDQGKGLAQCMSKPVFSEKGGFGLFLMEKLSDGFECYSSPGFGTTIEILFKNPKRVTIRGRRQSHGVEKGRIPVALKGVAGLMSHPQRGLSVYCETLGLEGIVRMRVLRPYWRVKAIISYVGSEFDDAANILQDGGFGLTLTRLRHIKKMLSVLEIELSRLRDEDRRRLTRELALMRRNLIPLKNDLLACENEKMPEKSGICALITRDELAQLVDEVTGCVDRIDNLIDERAGCWISFGGKKLHYI